MTSSPEGEGGDKPKDDKWWHDDEGGGGGGGEIWQRYLTLALSHIYPHCKTVNMFGFTNRKNSDIQGGWIGGSRLWRDFNCGQKSNIRCFVAKSIMSRVTRAMREGEAKKWRMMTRGRGGVTIPPKNNDVIYEQPLIVVSFSLWFQILNFRCYSIVDIQDVREKNPEKLLREGFQKISFLALSPKLWVGGRQES